MSLLVGICFTLFQIEIRNAFLRTKKKKLNCNWNEQTWAMFGIFVTYAYVNVTDNESKEIKCVQIKKLFVFIVSFRLNFNFEIDLSKFHRNIFVEKAVVCRIQFTTGWCPWSLYVIHKRDSIPIWITTITLQKEFTWSVRRSICQFRALYKCS